MVFVSVLLIQVVPFMLIDGYPDDVRVPSTPVLDPIDPAIDDDGTIILSWSVSSGAVRYTVYRGELINGQIWFDPIVSNYQYTTYTDIGLTTGTYSYKVRAYSYSAGSGYSNIQTVQVILIQVDDVPVLKSIESPNTDGSIELDWNDVSPVGRYEVGYNVYRLWAGSWTKIDSTAKGVSEYVDTVEENGVYKYYVTSKTFKVFPPTFYESEMSNIQSVTVDIHIPEPDPPPDILPSNPSIIINNGAETTDSLVLTLTLSCDNAEEMSFQIYYGMWTNWTVYKTTYTLTLSENNPDIPDFRIGVEFRNENGTTADAGYKDTWDGITYEEPTNGDGNDDGNGNGEPPVDYTWTYVGIGVLVALIGIIVYLKYRKRGIKLKSKSK